MMNLNRFKPDIAGKAKVNLSMSQILYEADNMLSFLSIL